MKLRLLACAAAIASATFGVNAANASIYLGLQANGVNSGNITTVATDSATPGAAGFLGSYGNFSVNILTGLQGTAPNILDSSAQDQLGSFDSGQIKVWATITDLTGPLGSPAAYFSGFTTNFLSTNWTVEEQTFLDVGNGIFSPVTALGDHTFLGDPLSVQKASEVDFADPGQGPYSITELYTVTARGAGESNSTIDVASAVPEPGTWAMMLAGLFGTGFMLRGSRKSSGAIALA
jgi:hypothetical protein